MYSYNKTDPTKYTRYYIVSISAFILILLVHLTSEHTGLHPAIFYAKIILFLCSSIALFIPISVDVLRIYNTSPKQERTHAILTTLAAIVGISILTFQAGVLSNGEDYSQRAFNPFMQTADLYSTRLLMPALGFFFFLRGYWPYYFLSLFITGLFVLSLYRYIKKTALVSDWHFFSICTVSFVIFHFQVPGYPDALVYLFFLLVMYGETSQSSKLGLLILALIAHENSIFIGTLLAFRYLNHRERFIYFGAIIFYALAWIVFAKTGSYAIINAGSVSNVSGLEWINRYPLREIFGVFISYKVLWFIFAWAIVICFQSRNFKDLLFILSNIGAAILLTFLAVDTSRLMGQAFPGFLVSLSILKSQFSTRRGLTIATMIFAINLILPSAYAGLVGGVFTWPGIYGWTFEYFYKVIIFFLNLI